MDRRSPQRHGHGGGHARGRRPVHRLIEESLIRAPSIWVDPALTRINVRIMIASPARVEMAVARFRAIEEAVLTMRMFTKAAILVAALAIPAATFAQSTAATTTTKKAPAAAKESGKAAVASHTTSGVVKSVSDSSLVITKGTGKSAKDETFT